ncbi:glycosyltransferase 87 family protein [Kitasatospora griseola]|uniref:glycosyltransferase 87 family protein n=1 Tax=Kitasatospora griseola TaxID=2064 RepID=UPI000697A9BD|nr:glycosyltransferase 87 family protein [Kitasatospora griseola]
MLTSLRQLVGRQSWLWPAGWLLCAVWAGVVPLVSPLGPHRDWGVVAAAGYLLAAVAAAPWWRRDTRLRSAVLALVTAGLLPLALALRTGAGQSEVTVIVRAGTQLLAHGSPYLDSPASALDLTPYLPAMAAFGLPRALLGPNTPLGDPRLWCAAAFLATTGATWHLLRLGGARRSPSALRARLPLARPSLPQAAGAALLRRARLPSTRTRTPLSPAAAALVASPVVASLQAAGAALGPARLRLARRTLVPGTATPPASPDDRRRTRRIHRTHRPGPRHPRTSLRTRLPSTRARTRTLLSPAAVALVASPVVALPLAVSGVDLPMTGLLCLALALAARRRAGGAGLALAAACALKWTAWPAVPVAVALLAAVAGRRAAWRCAGVAVAGATALMAPWLVLAPGPMVHQVFAFPLGLGEWRTPAASPLPGRLLAQLGTGGWWSALALLLLGGGAVAVSLVRRPPTDAVAAADRLAIGLTLAFLLAPAGRYGYLALPLFLAVFTRLASRRTPSPRRPAAASAAPPPATRRPRAPAAAPADPPVLASTP